jgi:glutathione S-transferase
VLELDDGSLISEATVICDYLDERFPRKAFGRCDARGARRSAFAAIRHIDYSIGSPMMNGFRSAEGLPMFEKPHAVRSRSGAGQQGLCAGRLAAGGCAFGNGSPL